ncbi:MAG TPA: L,D-transpeptidase family protein [Bdellovibrionales bacterium]|nr:L,D-transpeptidase family protein [Bdellovibrionales bacterium]
MNTQARILMILSMAVSINAASPLLAHAQLETGSIQQQLLQSTGSSRAWINQFYVDRGFAPAWTARGQLTYAAEQLRRAIATELPAHGLVAKDYWTPELESYLTTPLTGDQWLKAELALSKAFVEASIHLNIGRLDLKALANSANATTKTRFKDVKYERRQFTRWADLQAAFGSEGIESVWNRLAPQHKRYQDLKIVLARLRAIQAQGGFKAIAAPGTTLKVGSTGATVQALKVRAKLLGYPITNLDSTFDQEFSSVIRDIQAANLAEPTGYLSPRDSASWETFSVTSERRINQVELNMEKIRWLPETLEQRHIFVNLAIQELNVVDPNLTNPKLANMRVIVGQPARKTPSMRDSITDVVFNPNWTVPTTVFAEDKLSMIRDVVTQQGYAGLYPWFEQNRFTVKDGSLTQILDPTTIDWMNLNPKTTDIYIVQAPGYMNALGVVKIMLNNPWAIYLHDTNARDKFAQAHRALSSGCMRLSAPLDLAEYLLQSTSWDRTRMESLVATPDGPAPLKSTWAKPLPANKLPVYTLSVTARLGDDGVMRFTRDVYSQNLYILEALQTAGFYKK